MRHTLFHRETKGRTGLRLRQEWDVDLIEGFCNKLSSVRRIKRNGDPVSGLRSGPNVWDKWRDRNHNWRGQGIRNSRSILTYRNKVRGIIRYEEKRKSRLVYYKKRIILQESYTYKIFKVDRDESL